MLVKVPWPYDQSRSWRHHSKEICGGVTLWPTIMFPGAVYRHCILYVGDDTDGIGQGEDSEWVEFPAVGAEGRACLFLYIYIQYYLFSVHFHAVLSFSYSDRAVQKSQTVLLSAAACWFAITNQHDAAATKCKLHFTFVCTTATTKETVLLLQNLEQNSAKPLVTVAFCTTAQGWNKQVMIKRVEQREPRERVMTSHNWQGAV